MRLQGIPFWLENNGDGTTPFLPPVKNDIVVTEASTSTVVTTSSTPFYPVTLDNAMANSSSYQTSEVNGNYATTVRSDQSDKSLIPPLRQPKSYGSIETPVRINSVDEDSEDDGFPSKESWSARRRRSSIKTDICCLQYLGIILTMFHTVFSSLSGLTVKLLEDTYHPYNICFWRFTTVFTISVLVMCMTKVLTNIKLWPRRLVEEKYENKKNILLLLLRGILGCAGRILYIYSITCMTLSDAMVIASSSPVFMTFFAYFLLGESCGLVPVAAALITLIGVGVITRPPWLTGGGSFDKSILLGTGTGVGGMVLTTLVMIVMRKLRHVNVTLITLSFASWGMVAALILCLHNGVFVFPYDNLTHVLLLIASGATSFLGQTFLTLGLKYENAGVVALLTNFAVVFSFIFEYIFLHISPDIYSITGGIIVIFCIILTTFRKWIGTLPDYHEVRKVFFFLLV